MFTPFHPIPLRFTLIVLTYVDLGLSSGSFCPNSSWMPCINFFLPHAYYMSCQLHHPWFHHIFSKECTPWSASLQNVTNPSANLPPTPFSLSTLFWNTLSLCPCPNATDWELHPHKTQHYSSECCRLHRVFRYQVAKTKDSSTNDKCHSSFEHLLCWSEVIMPSEWTHYEHIPVVNLLFKHE